MLACSMLRSSILNLMYMILILYPYNIRILQMLVYGIRVPVVPKAHS